MSIIFMFLLYICALFFAVISVVSKWLTLIIGIPLTLFSITRFRRYFGYFAMIFAGMATWVSFLSILNVVLNWPIHRLLMLVLTLVSSIAVGVGIFLSYKKHFHEEPKVRMQVKKTPRSARESLASLDTTIQYKKNKVKQFGWIGWFMTPEDEVKTDNSLYFVLGEEVELEKRKSTNR